MAVESNAYRKHIFSHRLLLLVSRQPTKMPNANDSHSSDLKYCNSLIVSRVFTLADWGVYALCTYVCVFLCVYVSTLIQKPLDIIITKLGRWIVHDKSCSRPFYLRSKGQMSSSAWVCTLLSARLSILTTFLPNRICLVTIVVNQENPILFVLYSPKISWICK